MKKIGSFLLLFLLLFACFMIPKDVFAENISLNSVSVSSKSVKPGNQVRFTFNTTGDVSYITANWRLKDSYSGAGETFVISTAASGNSNSVNYTIPSEIKNGEYELSEVVLWRSDYTYDVIYAYNFDTTSSTITVSGSTWDGNVSSQPITIKKVEELGHYCDTVENYCEFFIGVEFNSGSKVNYATIGSEKNSFNENMMQRAENYYISSIVISVPTYIYYVDTIEAYSYNYDTEFALEDVYSKAEIQLKMDNFIEDKVSPSLSSIQYHTNEVTAPGSFEFSLHVRDNYPEYSYSSRNNVSIKTENGDNVSNLMCSTEEDSEGWIYHCSVSFGKYTDVTGVYIDSIEIEDAAGNLKTLSVDDGTITKKVIKVKSGGSLDGYIVIQNDSYDMTDMIHSLKDGDKVIFDLNYNSVVPKVLFDQIKGKNIEVSFLPIADGAYKGVEWKTNGKNITGTTRDVDLEVNLDIDNYSKYVLDFVEEYEPDFDYDHSKTTCQNLNSYMEKVRQGISGYFDRMKSEGYSNTDDYKTRVLAAASFDCDDTVSGVGSGSVADFISSTLGGNDYYLLFLEDSKTFPGKMDVTIDLDFMSNATYSYYFEREDFLYLLDDEYDSKNVTITVNTSIPKLVKEVLEKDPSSVKRGDLSRDGEVTFTDVIVCLRKVFGYVSVSADDITVGDLNNNGSLDFTDVIILLRYVFGYITNI